jgi:FeS assembly SUF system regulator
MIRISRMTDYATVILAALAREPEACLSAPALSERTRIGMPTVSKVLKALHRGGLVRSTRGQHGGYALARPPAAISAAAILDVIEGPVAVTDCSAGRGHCEIETTCGVGHAWQRCQHNHQHRSQRMAGTRVPRFSRRNRGSIFVGR